MTNREAHSLSPAPAKFDPYSLELWGLSKREHTAVLVAAAVLVRMSVPSDPAGPGAAPVADTTAAPALGSAPAPPADDHDVLLRRLRELGELYEAGILTDEEFATAKRAVLKRL